jgi:hypothetical protein
MFFYTMEIRLVIKVQYGHIDRYTLIHFTLNRDSKQIEIGIYINPHYQPIDYKIKWRYENLSTTYTVIIHIISTCYQQLHFYCIYFSLTSRKCRLEK